MKIEQEMTIYTASELWQKLRDFAKQLPANGCCELDMSEVSELDTAGAQILLMLRRLLNERNMSFSICQISQTAKESLQMLGLTQELLPAQQ